MWSFPFTFFIWKYPEGFQNNTSFRLWYYQNKVWIKVIIKVSVQYLQYSALIVCMKITCVPYTIWKNNTSQQPCEMINLDQWMAFIIIWLEIFKYKYNKPIIIPHFDLILGSLYLVHCKIRCYLLHGAIKEPLSTCFRIKNTLKCANAGQIILFGKRHSLTLPTLWVVNNPRTILRWITFLTVFLEESSSLLQHKHPVFIRKPACG